MKKKEHEKDLCRSLRRQGKSLNEIARLIGVAKSSVSYWVRDIRIKASSKPNWQQGVEKRSKLARNARMSFQDDGMRLAKNAEPLHIKGCMLYWAEGAKCRNSCDIVNTDPVMLVLFMKFLRQYFDLEDSDFRVKINCYTNNGLSVQDIEDYWLNCLNLPRSCLRKTMKNNKPRSSSGKEGKHKHPYGMCSVCVHKTNVVQHIYGAIQEYAGIKERYGLDFTH